MMRPIYQTIDISHQTNDFGNLKYFEITCRRLSRNPSAVALLEQNENLIDWVAFAFNPNPECIPLWEKHYKKIVGLPALVSLYLPSLATNPVAIPFLEKILEKTLDNLEKENHQFNQDIIIGLARNSNPDAIRLMEKYIETIAKKYGKPTHTYVCGWSSLSRNPNAIPFLEKYIKYIEHINWMVLSANPNAIPLLEKYPTKIEWRFLLKNPNALPLIEANMDKIDSWYLFGGNPNPAMVAFIEKHWDIVFKHGLDSTASVSWEMLSENPVAVPLLEKYPHLIWYRKLAVNPNAIHLIEQHLKLKNVDINWCLTNPNAVPLIERWRDQLWEENAIDSELCSNPNAMHLIAKLDYAKMKENNCAFANELAKVVFHPVRVMRVGEQWGMSMEEYLDVL